MLIFLDVGEVLADRRAGIERAPGMARKGKNLYMVYPSQHPICRVQSPLGFDLCLRAVRSILRQDKFQIVSEALFPEDPGNSGVPRRQRHTVLVVWSASYACQALSTDRDAGLLVPFCLSVLEDGTHSMVAASCYTRLAVATGTVGIRILARVLDTKINQIFLQLSAHGSAHESVKQGGGTYRGIQYGSPERGMPDLVLFDDPVTKTTLALALDGSPVCPEAVRSKIKDSRQVFHEARVARNQSQLSDRSWDTAASAISCPV
jgi:uncharacterized protein (DUF302 family)